MPTNEDVFDANQAVSSGPLEGFFLWSDANNWSQGVPTDGASVDAAGIDDLGSLSLNTLTESSGVDVVDAGGTLSIGTLVGGTDTSLIASTGFPGEATTVTVTVGTITKSGGDYYASGSGASFVDNSATDPGETYTADGGGTLVLAAAPASSSTLNYEAGGTIALEHPSAVENVAITGLSPDDVLELPAVKSVVIGSNSLLVTTSVGSYDFTNVSYDLPVSGYTSAVDPNTGLEAITFTAAACYLAGTRILTANGRYVAVENLQIGDLVVTQFGTLRPVRWLGYRDIDCRQHPQPSAIWPIRIRAGAVADQQPAQDVWVSPGHGIFIDGVLVQAELLINGATVFQEPRDHVEYWHLELDQHDIIFAEGMLSESYLNTGNRAAFSNGGEVVVAHPDFRPKHWTETCVPLVLEGDILVRARTMVWARTTELGFTTTREPDLHIVADGRRIEPIHLVANRFAFILPAATGRVALHSRSFIPMHVIPESRDSRRLGLCIGKLQIDGSEVALDDDAMFTIGWHALERHSHGLHRWTQGVARLPAGARLIVLELAGPSFYLTVAASLDKASECSERLG